jgi:hypothetical protein
MSRYGMSSSIAVSAMASQYEAYGLQMLSIKAKAVSLMKTNSEMIVRLPSTL